MIEYILLLCWLISIALCLQKKDWLYNLFGMILILYVGFNLYNTYTTVFDSAVFVVFSVAGAFLGFYRLFRALT